MYAQQIFHNLNRHESRKMSIFLKKVSCESQKLNTFSSKEIWKRCQFSKKSIFLAEGPHDLSFRTKRWRSVPTFTLIGPLIHSGPGRPMDGCGLLIMMMIIININIKNKIKIKMMVKPHLRR